MDYVDLKFTAQSVNDREKPPRTQPAAKTPVLDPKLQSDIFQVKDVFEKFNTQVIKYESSIKPKKDDKNSNLEVAGLSVIPFYRRFSGVEEAIKDHDTFKTAAKTLIALINVPEDAGDLVKVKNQIKSKIKGEAVVVPHDYQTKFSFFRGTLFEPILKKLVDSNNEKISKLGRKINNSDKTLFESKLGQKTCKLLDISIVDVKETTRVDKIRNKAIKAYKLEGNTLSKLICRSMMRVPLISLGIVAAIELPSVIKSFFKGDSTKDKIGNGIKQTAKATVNVSLITVSTAIIGALFASKKGHIGSLAGIGIGSFIGSRLSSTIDKKLDNN